MQGKIATGGARPILNDQQFAQWTRANMDAFDRLPSSIRDAIRDTGVEVDCMKLEKCIQLNMPELEIIVAIYDRAKRLHETVQ